MYDFPILALFPMIHRQDEPDIVVLWSWAYMKELLAACKGKKLKEREIEARIQHFLSVLKVTLLKSTQVDFASESWKGARLYHDKDQQKIDIGVENWVQISNQ